MPGFFLNAKTKPKKRKRAVGKKNPAPSNKSKRNEEIESEDEDDESIHSGNEENREPVAEEESDEETAAEKRLRLAKDYISQIEHEEKEKAQDDDWRTDPIASRLQQDALEDAGRLEKFIAGSVAPDIENIKTLQGHRLSVTCTVISADARFIFSASKDGTICKWNLQTCEKVVESDGLVGEENKSSSITCEKIGKIDGKSKKSKSKAKAHVGQVLCLALSTDFTFLASGGHDQLIHIWNPVTLEWIHTFKGHRAMISGLAFQQKQHQLFSASNDKTIKVWNLDQMAYVETLFGHEDAVLGIASLNRSRAVTCGGRDRSVRLWKIPEESQLVFQSSQGSSFDCVTMLNEDYFLTGGDDGSLSVFFTRKKKPITLRTNAHMSTAQHKIHNNKKNSEDNNENINDNDDNDEIDNIVDNNENNDNNNDNNDDNNQNNNNNNNNNDNNDNDKEEADTTENIATTGPRGEGWISAVTCAPYTDLVASGSSDGIIRLWRCEKSFRAILPIHEIPVVGFVNSLQFSSDCEFLIVGVGQEHRLGRWWSIKEAKNSVLVIPMKKIDDGDKTDLVG